MGKQRKGDKSGGSYVNTWQIDTLAWACPVPHQHCLSCLLKFLPNSALDEDSLCSMHIGVLVKRPSPAIAVGPWLKGDVHLWCQ